MKNFVRSTRWREISPSKLHLGGSYDTIRMDILATHDARYGTRVYGSGETSSENLFALFFPQEIEISPVYCVKLNYDAGHKRQPMPTIPSGIIQQEIPQFAMCEQQSDWGP